MAETQSRGQQERQVGQLKIGRQAVRFFLQRFSTAHAVNWAELVYKQEPPSTVFPYENALGRN
jgi:hypothetical protein